MMMKDEDMKRLTERFFEGGTTLEEEQMLYAYYNGKDVVPDLEVYAELFRNFAALPFSSEDGEMAHSVEMQTNKAAPVALRPHIKRLRKIAIAASITLLVGFGAYYVLSSNSSDNECVAYIYGKKCTDPDLVIMEMQRTLSDMNEMDEENEMESQLIDMFTTE